MSRLTDLTGSSLAAWADGGHGAGKRSLHGCAAAAECCVAAPWPFQAAPGPHSTPSSLELYALSVLVAVSISKTYAKEKHKNLGLALSQSHCTCTVLRGSSPFSSKTSKRTAVTRSRSSVIRSLSSVTRSLSSVTISRSSVSSSDLAKIILMILMDKIACC